MSMLGWCDLFLYDSQRTASFASPFDSSAQPLPQIYLQWHFSLHLTHSLVPRLQHPLYSQSLRNLSLFVFFITRRKSQCLKQTFSEWDISHHGTANSPSADGSLVLSTLTTPSSRMLCSMAPVHLEALRENLWTNPDLFVMFHSQLPFGQGKTKGKSTSVP